MSERDQRFSASRSLRNSLSAPNDLGAVSAFSLESRIEPVTYNILKSKKRIGAKL